MEAYAHSVHGAAPALAPHKSLPRSRHALGDLPPSAQQPMSPPSPTAGEPADPQVLRVKAKSPLGSPILLDGDATLPPTPPSTWRDDVPTAGADGPRDASGSLRALSSQKSGLSTPTTGRSPPTPDITPPAGRFLRATIPSPIVSLATSQAESFRTAREEQPDYSSDEGGFTNYTLVGERDASTRAYQEATRALQHGDRGLGFDFEREDCDSTPTQEQQRRLRQRQRQRQPRGQQQQQQQENALLLPKLRGSGNAVRMPVETALQSDFDAGDGDRDRHLPRNVTLRPSKQPRTPPSQAQQQHDHSPQWYSEPRSQRSPVTGSPSSIRPTPGGAPPPRMDVASARVFSEPTHILHRSIRNIDAKRLSDVSSPSTVVEAVIRIATPQSGGRRLRHVSKVTGLRSLSGSAISVVPSSPGAASRSDRGAPGSGGIPPQKLHHKRPLTSERKEQQELDTASESTASPVLRRPLRHSRDYSHLRSSADPSTSPAVGHEERSPQKLRKSAELESEASPQDSTKFAEARPSTSNAADVTPRLHSHPYTRHVLDDDMHPEPGVAERTDVRAGQAHGAVPSTAVPAHAEPDSQPRTTQRKSVLKSKPEKLELGPFPYSQQPPSPVRNRAHSASTVESPHQLMPVVPLQMQQHSRAMRARLGSNATDASDDYRRVSFGDDMRSTHDGFEYFPRKSVDSRLSNTHMLDELASTTGHVSLYPPVTPLSMSSMRSEAQIAEAKAINFYPHTNESLLFIQHGPAPGNELTHGPAVYPRLNGSPIMPAELHRAIDAVENPSTPTPPPTRVTTTTETEDILHLTPPNSASRAARAPQLLLEPSTPTTAMAPSDVDSPLRNPRSAPQPPAFKVIPPTPFSEVEDPLAKPQPQPSSSQAPVRRISLMQRARRYSDSFIQPLFMRTVSVKRVVRPATGDEAAARDRNLHPLWRPRGFWDDFSDSESDDEWWGDGELVYADEGEATRRRLPRGGDTSDVYSPEEQRQQRQQPTGPVLGRMGSVRKVIMDGFRGSGGFLIGNTLGFERAGTNRRRHHISLPTRLQARYAPNRGVATLPAHVSERYSSAGAAHHHVARLSNHHDSDEQNQQQQGGKPPLLVERRGPAAPIAGGAGFTHNPTQPLSSVTSRPATRGPTRRTVSLSSFPSSYSSTAAASSSPSLSPSHSQSKRRGGRAGWRRNIQFPFRVEYVGIRGVADRLREKKAEKRREDLRRRIGRGVLQDGAEGYYYGTLRDT